MAKKNEMYVRTHVPFTAERKALYLEYYRHSGLKYRSAELIGVSVSTLEEHIRKDLEFGAAVLEAKQTWVDETLIKPAIERAVKGVKKPIIGGKDRDSVVAYEQVYSDGLHLALLRARSPEFRDKDGEGSGGGGGVLVVPAAPSTMDQWQTQFGDLAKGTTGKPH
jgi:hypothetical protein